MVHPRKEVSSSSRPLLMTSGSAARWRSPRSSVCSRSCSRSRAASGKSS